MPESLKNDVNAAAGRPEVVAAVWKVYEALDRRLTRRRPRCDASGRCCRFEAYGHRLFVTTVELAAMVAGAKSGGYRLATDDWDGTGCPYQVGGLCGLHPIRPFGCRIYFCDPSSTSWQERAYERLHQQLRRVHEQTGVPYAYVEWRSSLRALGLAEPAMVGGRRLTVLPGGTGGVNGSIASCLTADIPLTSEPNGE